MSDLVKGAFILAAAAIVAVAMGIYFSPYHSCVRSVDRSQALACAAYTSGSR